MTRPNDANERLDFDADWDYAEPAKTAERFLRRLNAARDAGDPGYLAQLLSQLARAKGLTQRFDEAHTLLDEAEAMLGRATPIARARCLLERGRVLNSSGRPDEAAPLFERALDVAREAGSDFYAVDAAHMLEIVTAGKDKLRWNGIACELAASSESALARGWLGSLYNNRGWTLHELGRLEEALDVFERHLAHLRANDPREDRIAIARWSVAKTLRLLGRPTEALPVQESLAVTSPADGYVHEELGECLLALGREAEARPRFARAHELLAGDRWLARDEPERLARLERLGRDTPA